jgi:hypothetical protein
MRPNTYFADSELTLGDEKLTDSRVTGDTAADASDSVLEFQDSALSAVSTHVTEEESVDPVDATPREQQHYAVVEKDGRVRSCYIHALKDLADEEAKMHPAGTFVILRSGAIEDSSILEARLQWTVVDPAKDDREKDRILSRHDSESWISRKAQLGGLVYRLAPNIE